ncbi:MAG: hypothetical protein VKQ33_01615 [Candidatus Sericytochromatia bacterium]|nr:hypothetical protein [Candidatus Sericytochromatia bacterium]
MAHPVLRSLVLALALAGCATPFPGGPVLTGPGTQVPLKDPVTGRITSNQPVEPLAGISFRPLTVANARFLSGQGGPAGAAMAEGATMGGAAIAAPMAASAPAADMAMPAGKALGGGNAGGSPASVGGAYSGNVWGGYGYQYYFGFGGGSERMSLVSVQEAETQGSQGGFTEVLSGIVAPIVKDWAPDARLTEAGSTLGSDGRIWGEQPVLADLAVSRIAPIGRSPLEAGEGWRLVYLSSARNEMLQFVVSAEKTTLVRLRWAPLDLQPERIQVDASAAITSLTKAITDKAFASEEEKSGLDYFLGHAFEQPKTGAYDHENHQTEVLYEVPRRARWSVNLQQIVGKLVWELSWHAAEEARTEPGVTTGSTAVAVAPPTARFTLLQEVAARPMPMPTVQPPCLSQPRQETNVYTSWSGSGLVDAETGAVIRFTRPTRTTNTWDNYVCEEPAPEPVEPPRPAPSAEPGVVPEPSPGTTPDGGATDTVAAG